MSSDQSGRYSGRVYNKLFESRYIYGESDELRFRTSIVHDGSDRGTAAVFNQSKFR